LKPEDIAEIHLKANPREAGHTTTPARNIPEMPRAQTTVRSMLMLHVIKERSFGAESTKPEKFTDPVNFGLDREDDHDGKIRV